MSAPSARLILAATPLGNPADASDRLRAALAQTPVIAAEDTRRVRRLCADLGVLPTGRIVSFFDANEASRVPSLLETLRDGQDVLVVTDAGMPSVSDPGYRLVAAAVEAAVPVTVLPGPSAVLAALAVSGLPVDRFCFEGFLPRQPGPRKRALADLADEERTMIFFEAPHRLAGTLADMVEVFGDDRPAAICRELTKTYEEVRRGSLGELAASGPAKGEITVVVGGVLTAPVSLDPRMLAALVKLLEATGMTRKDAIARVAAQERVPKRTVFDAVVAAKAP